MASARRSTERCSTTSRRSRGAATRTTTSTPTLTRRERSTTSSAATTAEPPAEERPLGELRFRLAPALPGQPAGHDRVFPRAQKLASDRCCDPIEWRRAVEIAVAAVVGADLLRPHPHAYSE